MINRVLIRLKIVQVVYAYYQNGGKTIDAAEKELMFSLSKAYDLYKTLLLLIPAVVRYAQERIEVGRAKLAPTPQDLNPNMKFVRNRFAQQLQANRQLQDFAKSGRTWDNDGDFVRSLYDSIVGSDIYCEYMSLEGSSYGEDRELWRKLYRTFIQNNEDLDALLEDKSLYWNDDKTIVDTFVLKTIKRFDEANGSDQPLLPEFKDDEDREFASRLLRRALINGESYRKLISDNIRNWDLDRVAFMDVIIMQCAMSELMSFPGIPISVTLNEYVEIAKAYSTSKSGAFVNGTLDGIVKVLKNEGKLLKN